jgi:hypothetical protein
LLQFENIILQQDAIVPTVVTGQLEASFVADDDFLEKARFDKYCATYVKGS